jgi:hypothetical protein
VCSSMAIKLKRAIRTFCAIVVELEMPLIRMFVLLHLYKTLFGR